METLDSRLKRIEQRLSGIEKFIAENMVPGKNKDLSLRLGRVSSPVDVAEEYHYNYRENMDPSQLVRAPIHKVDSSIFNQRQKEELHQDTIVTAVSGLIIVLGLFFLGRFLMDASWLSPISLIALGAVFSIAFIAGGISLKESGSPGVQYLPIIGIVLLNVCLYGASNYYSLIPKNVSLIGALAISWLSLFVYREIEADIYQILAAVGAYIMPLYISFGSDQVFTNLYYLAATFSFMVIAIRMRLMILAVLGAYLALVVSGVSDYIDDDHMNKIMFSLGHFVMYGAAYLFMAIRSDKEINRQYTYLFFPFVLLFYIFEYYYIGHIGVRAQNIFSVTFGLSLAAAYLVVGALAKEKPVQFTQTFLGLSAVSVFSHLLFYSALPAKFRPMVLVFVGFGVMKLAQTAAEKNPLFSKLLTYFFMLITALSGMEVILQQFNTSTSLTAVNALIYACVLFYFAFFETHLANLKINRTITSAIGHVFILSAVYGLLKDKVVMLMLGGCALYTLAAVTSIWYFHKPEQESAPAPQATAVEASPKSQAQ